MATLNVGAGQAYATVSAAVNAARDGDVLAVQAGTYTNDFATISKDITIKGVGGMANFVATVAPPNGKAIFVTQGDVTIENLSFSGAKVADMNGAGIRYEGGNLVVMDSYFHNNQDGILAGSDPNGTIRIVDSEFGFNGAGDGYSHNLYVNNVASLVIENSYFHDADVGHQIKSRAQSTTITNSRIYDGNGTGSYSIDLPNGGVGVIRDNVIQQGPNSGNSAIIHYGGESAAYPGSSLLIADNVVVNDRSSAVMLSNATTVSGTLSGNDLWGLTAGQITNGSDKVSGTSYLSAHPSLDAHSPWLGSDDGHGAGPGAGPGDGPSTITGTAGADMLVGTAGADKMTGLAGDDQYVVNHAGDVVVEAQNHGLDTVLSSVSYTLAANVENMRLTGSGAINGTGNNLANVLAGNSADNTLDGGANADRMVGGYGNDIYRVDNAGDVVVERAGRGNDSVYTSVDYVLPGHVEQLQTANAAGTAAINLTGNLLDNRLIGNAGNNILDGRAGSDTLTGNGGADSFVFRDKLGPSNIDTITDFNVAQDTIRLENSIFKAITGTGTLTADQFVANASGKAVDGSDHIIYETDTGKLYYDSNGSAAGGATQFAELSPGLELTHKDFFIV